MSYAQRVDQIAKVLATVFTYDEYYGTEIVFFI